VGFIALAGVAAEFGVIMLLYLKQAWQERLEDGRESELDLLDAIREGAVLRVRPKAITAATILAGLLPIMLGSGTGSEVMQRIAAPMHGRGYDYRAPAVDAGDSGGIFADAALTEASRGLG
jgi:Cu(I)/Ag(I) efflux system membrane protein CusA/SilA